MMSAVYHGKTLRLFVDVYKASKTVVEAVAAVDVVLSVVVFGAYMTKLTWGAWRGAA